MTCGSDGNSAPRNRGEEPMSERNNYQGDIKNTKRDGEYPLKKERTVPC